MNQPPIHAVDLRNHPNMPLDVQALTKSRAWTLAPANPAIGFALGNLMIEAWHQVPAGSVPLDDLLLPMLARVDAATWAVVQEIVLAEFDLCSDGRYYHPAVVAQVAAAAAALEKKRQKSKAYSLNGKESGKARAIIKATKKTLAVAAEPAAAAEPVKQVKPVKPVKPAKAATASTEETDPRQLSLIASDAVMVADELVPAASATAAKGFKATKGPAEADIQAVYKHWLSVHGKRALLSPKRRAKIVAALKNYPMDDLLTAIEGCKASAHHQGDNRHNTVYDDLELILRDPEHIEMFRNMTTAKNNGGATARVMRPETEKALDDFDAYLRTKNNRGNGMQGELT